MSKNRPFVLSIAGFDPSAGAGVLADIKTFEQHKVYGFSIITANTIQTESCFYTIQWTPIGFVLESIEKLFNHYTIPVVKIGIVPSLDYLEAIVFAINKISPNTKIVWDTVLNSSTAFNFLEISNTTNFFKILKSITIITPNYQEITKLYPCPTANANNIAEKLSDYCAVLLKGGHNINAIGVDTLYRNQEQQTFNPTTTDVYPKHGSGCVLSAAIAANLALQQDIETACYNAKKYIETFLLTTTAPLGYHYV